MKDFCCALRVKDFCVRLRFEDFLARAFAGKGFSKSSGCEAAQGESHAVIHWLRSRSLESREGQVGACEETTGSKKQGLVRAVF